MSCRPDAAPETRSGVEDSGRRQRDERRGASRTAVGRLVMLRRWMSADDKRWLLERFPELAATLAHLDRCDAQIAVLTVGTRTEDTGLQRD